MRFTQVDPMSFVSETEQTPPHGRGAWTKAGIDFDYRYARAPSKEERIGTRAEISLDHWAVAAGCYAIQLRLAALNFYEVGRKGVFDSAMETAVKAFQTQNVDPINGSQLVRDGTVGMSDARALFTPVITWVQSRYAIPDKLLLGETNHESLLDPGAVGYYIYYPDYRGIDRGMSQINSKANGIVSWTDAFSPAFALDWSARRLRTVHDEFKIKFSATSDYELWNAAVCAHNNPSAALIWARTGFPPTVDAAKYVQGVRNSTY